MPTEPPPRPQVNHIRSDDRVWPQQESVGEALFPPNTAPGQDGCINSCCWRLARHARYGFLNDHKSVQINVYRGYSFSPSKLRRVLGVCTSASSVSFDPTFYRAGKCEAFGMKHALFEAGVLNHTLS